MSERIPDSRRNGEDTLAQRKSTADGAQGIFRRFVFVLLVVELFVGIGLATYFVFDSRSSMHIKLLSLGDQAIHVAQTLREETPRTTLTDEAVIEQASRLTGCEMGLVTRDGHLAYATGPAMRSMVDRAYAGGITVPSQRYPVLGGIGDLRGGWFARSFSEQHDLLVVVKHSPESEGLLMYLSISAGVLMLSLATSVLVMLGTANWMLHRPLARLVLTLTSAMKTDMERRRAAEQTAVQARLEAEAHLSFLDNLINASFHFGVVAANTEDNIILVNKTAEAVLGFSEAEAVGKMTLTELLSRSRRRSTHEAPLRSLMKLQEGDVFVTDRSGNEHLVAANLSDIVDADGKASGRLMVFVDVTERRRLDVELQLKEMQLEQSAKLAGLGEMATGVAHELNQPLNNIGLLASRVLRKLSVSGESRDFEVEKLRKIQGQVHRASKIIDHLRTFARPTVGGVKSFPVIRPVESVLDLSRDQLATRGIDLVVDVPDGLPDVMADESQLEQVLINLLNNARDSFSDLTSFTEPPRIRIKAETEIHLDDGLPRVCLHVEDNGPGMTDDVCSRVFQPFFTTKEVGKGTGLGLSISYGLVRGFGGTLAFQSRLGEGTTFSILLRTQPNTDSPPATDSAPGNVAKDWTPEEP
ncbi:MAG: ATP-binding protein [Polyangiaceae bacterium]|nr:ATP-binding protein [Polyangiaceae bacterium]